MGNAAAAAGERLRPSACTLQPYRTGWFLCLDDKQKERVTKACQSQGKDRIEELMRELFRLQDLKKDGVLEEGELIKLNEKIAMLHYGKDIDREEIKEKYRTLFREKLNPEGKPVTYGQYRLYLQKVLAEIDTSLAAQEMILEQWVAEADSARQAFFYPSLQSIGDAEYLANLSWNGPGSLGPLQGPGAAALPPTAARTGSLGLERLPPTATAGSLSSNGAAKSGGYAGDSLTSAGRRAAGPPPFDSSELPARSLRSVNEADPPLFGPGAGGSLSNVPPSVSFADSEAFPPTATVELPRGGARASDAGRCQGFAVGQRIQVWSGSRQAWLSGVVTDAFEKDTKAEGFAVPAGTVKVTSDAGVKWVQPGDVATTLRREEGPPAGSMVLEPPMGTIVLEGPPSGSILLPAAADGPPPPFAAGDRLEVWSGTHGMWLEGSVLEAFASAATADGFAVPAGTLKVRSAAGVKWILAEKASGLLRPLGAGSGDAASAAQKAEAEVSSDYAKGDKVEVWSGSKKAWLDATVAEVFATEAVHDGYAVPAGSVKVVSDAGTKWLSREDVGKQLRRKPGPSGAKRGEPARAAGAGQSMKQRVRELLEDDSRLLTHVESIWSALGCSREGLARRSSPAALEAFACQFGLHLDLEGQYLDAVLQKFDSFDADGDGFITMLELRGLTQALMLEVYKMM